ncbi:hypothetical protein GGI43DRAFT_399569 [Trichoderma evansii]
MTDTPAQTPRRKSRFGCRNCKLRKIKCDETKPRCNKCTEYKILCNFALGIPDLQLSAGGMASHRGSAGILSPPSSLPVICSDASYSFRLDSDSLMKLEQFRSDITRPFSANMTKIWKDEIPFVAFQHPYLMHAMLAVATAFRRTQHGVVRGCRTQTEIHHTLQCVYLFKRKLSQLIAAPDQDAIWATSALLGLLAIVSFEETSPEDAWPVRPVHASDLEWMRLTVGKSIIWTLTDPLRTNGLFRAMASEYADMEFSIPEIGIAGIPSFLIEACNLTETSNGDNNPYYVAAHLLVLLARLQMLLGGSFPGIYMITFISQSQLRFRRLLEDKDPVSLLLLALWYREAGKALWWVRQRAEVDTRAIRIYLERFHYNQPGIIRLLP